MGSLSCKQTHNKFRIATILDYAKPGFLIKSFHEFQCKLFHLLPTFFCTFIYWTRTIQQNNNIKISTAV